MSVVAVALFGVDLGATSMASFNAVVTNSGSTFSTGSLLMTNGSCTSTTSGTNCGGSISLSNLIPGDIKTSTGAFTIVNSGSLPASMTLTISLNGATTNNLNTELNLAIEDDTSGIGPYCVYGHSASPATTPVNGSCSLSTTLQANYAFPTSGGPIGPISLPGATFGTAQWASGESHSYTIQVAASSTAASGSTAAIDLQWAGTQ